MASFHVGEHVWAKFSDADGVVLGHVETVSEDGDGKHQVQNPTTGKAEPLAYREPAGPDADEGRTFWKV